MGAGSLPWAGWLVFAALLAVPLGRVLALCGLSRHADRPAGGPGHLAQSDHRYAGQFAMSHAAFYGIGAYASAMLIEHAGAGLLGIDSARRARCGRTGGGIG